MNLFAVRLTIPRDLTLEDDVDVVIEALAQFDPSAAQAGSDWSWSVVAVTVAAPDAPAAVVAAEVLLRQALARLSPRDAELPVMGVEVRLADAPAPPLEWLSVHSGR